MSEDRDAGAAKPKKDFKDEALMMRMETELFHKYDLEPAKTVVEHYSQYLFFVDCVRILVEQMGHHAVVPPLVSWIKDAFYHLWRDPGQHNEDTSDDFLKRLEEHMKFRSFILTNQLSVIDVVVV